MVSSKRPHTKTRHGCKKCRERRVRCDLQKPQCGNCVKRKVSCPYLEDATPEQLHHTLAPGRPANSDIKLMHHYTTATCFAISQSPAHYHVWQHVVPTLAFDYEFLLHGLLALAALHRCHIPSLPPEEKPKLVALARNHKHLALSPYIDMLKHSSSANCQALFAFSVLLGSLCFAMVPHDSSEAAESFLDDLHHISTLLTGAVAIAYKYRDALHASELAPLLGMNLEPVGVSDLPDGIRQSFQTIREASDRRAPGLPSADREACLVSMGWLGALATPPTDVNLDDSGPSSQHAALVAWPIMLGSTFMELVAARDTLALVVLAHYGAIMHQHRHVWFLEGIGRRTVQAVTAEVGKRAYSYVKWPESIIARSLEFE